MDLNAIQLCLPLSLFFAFHRSFSFRLFSMETVLFLCCFHLCLHKLQEKKQLPQEKKDDQKAVDTALIKSIEAVPELKTYLGARFSLKSGMKPHELVF